MAKDISTSLSEVDVHTLVLPLFCQYLDITCTLAATDFDILLSMGRGRRVGLQGFGPELHQSPRFLATLDHVVSFVINTVEVYGTACTKRKIAAHLLGYSVRGSHRSLNAVDM